MNRNLLIKHIQHHITKEGGLNALASKYGFNTGALSAIIRGKYQANDSKMLSRIAVALKYKERDWQVVRTISNYKIIENLFINAKNEAMWYGLSNKAGSGKTETLEDLYNQDTTGAVIFLQCEEWTGRQFMMKLVEKTCGVNATGGYQTLSSLIEQFTNYVLESASDLPVLIIDEADKLKPSALRTLIPLYNNTEHQMGAIISGTENLEKEIKKGVRAAKKGYDEVDSRLGRMFMSLPGASEKDVKAICRANGVTNEDVIEKIWFQLEKTTHSLQKRGDKEVLLCEDLRRLMRVIKRERIKSK